MIKRVRVSCAVHEKKGGVYFQTHELQCVIVEMGVLIKLKQALLSIN